MEQDNATLLSHLNLDGDEVDQAALDRAHATAIKAVKDFIGYEPEEPVPAPVITAVLQLTAHLYENRELIISGERAYALPYGIFDLIGPYRDWTF